MNVAIRMEPNQHYPFNGRSFFTDKETRDIGGGLVLWRGYFQSVRPTFGKMLINVDISTGTMYKPGPLLSLCLEFLGQQNPSALGRSMPDRERLRLQKFITGIRITTPPRTPDSPPGPARVIKKLSAAGARDLMFQMRDGPRLSVADYFRLHANKPLRFPDVLCIEVSGC